MTITEEDKTEKTYVLETYVNIHQKIDEVLYSCIAETRFMASMGVDVDKVLPEEAWVFGYDGNEYGYSLLITAEEGSRIFVGSVTRTWRGEAKRTLTQRRKLLFSNDGSRHISYAIKAEDLPLWVRACEVLVDNVIKLRQAASELIVDTRINLKLKSNMEVLNKLQEKL